MFLLSILIGQGAQARSGERRGPIVVYAGDQGITRAFRNVPGVTLIHVDRLNILKLAPGGQMGRLTVWTQPAFERLETIYGSWTRPSETKADFVLPRAMMTNDDLARILQSDEVQAVLARCPRDMRA